MCIYVSICIYVSSIYLYVSMYLFIIYPCLSIYVSIYVSMYLSMYIYLSLFIYHLSSIFLSIYQSSSPIYRVSSILLESEIYFKRLTRKVVGLAGKSSIGRAGGKPGRVRRCHFESESLTIEQIPVSAPKAADRTRGNTCLMHPLLYVQFAGGGVNPSDTTP